VDRIARFTIIALILGLSGSAYAAEKPHFDIPRTASEVTIDGRIEETEWEGAVAIDLGVEIDPGKNVPAPVKTMAWLMYDANNLYAAFHAQDPDPKAIRAHLADRDTPFRDDFVGLILDTFNDERRGVELFVNPLGVQMDLSLDETATEEEEDAAWDAIWSSAGRIDETGYTVEMAIPYTSLRFQRSDGPQTWGIIPFRSYPRSLRHQIAPMPTDPDDSCFLCQAPKMTGFDGATPGRNLELDPTLTSSRTDAQRSFPRGELEEGGVDTNLGLTARWGITPNLVLSGTVNPDFSQVEADVAQLDVTSQFALFFPEKRPFFLEGGDFFSTPLNVVHTRTVADPSWGLKLTGKEGGNGLGVFVAQDEVTSLLIPGDQFSQATILNQQSTDAALRYRRDLGTSSTLGALVTTRQGEDGYANSVFGVDGRFRPTTSDTISVQALSSQSEYPGAVTAEFGQRTGSFDGSAMRLGYNHSERNWNWYARYEDLSPDFRADLGFLPRVGTTVYLGGLERNFWAEEKKAWYTRISVGGDWDRTDGVDGTTLEEELEVWVSLAGPYQSYSTIDVGRRERFWNGVTFDQDFVNVFFEMRPTGDLYLALGGTMADTIDFDHTRAGKLLQLDPSIAWNVGKRLRLTLDHHLQRVDIDEGELLEANLSQLGAVYQINLRTFVRAMFQYTDIGRDAVLYTARQVEPEDEELFTQLLFSYKLNPQTVLFLGYSDNQLGGTIEGNTIRLTRTDRTLFFKVGYALVM
jgi:hypothetical protein